MCFQIHFLLFCIYSVESSSAPTHLLVTRAGPCYGISKTAIRVSELSLSTHTYDSLLSGELNITEDIDNGWKIKATMKKCVDIRNIESCDMLRSYFMVNNGCTDEDEDEQEMLTMLFHYAKPKIRCPVQAGRYRITNYPLFTEDNYLAVHETKISASIFGYTIRLEGFSVNHQKIIFCAEAHLQLFYMREHDWVKNKDIQVTTAAPSGSE